MKYTKLPITVSEQVEKLKRRGLKFGNETKAEDYLSNITIDSLLLPELFIGFNLLNVNGELWQQNFDTPVTSLLSFSGVPLKTSATVAEPSKVILLILSLLIIVSGRHYQPKALKISS